MIFYDFLNIPNPSRNRFLNEDGQFVHFFFLESLVPQSFQSKWARGPDFVCILQTGFLPSCDIFYCFFVLCVLVFEHVKCFCKLCLEHAPTPSLLLASPRPKLKNGRLFLLALPTGVGYFRNVTNEDAVFVLLVGARYYLPVVERQGDQLFPPWCCSCGTWRH